jgi:hypothetical protein
MFSIAVVDDLTGLVRISVILREGSRSINGGQTVGWWIPPVSPRGSTRLHPYCNIIITWPKAPVLYISQPLLTLFLVCTERHHSSSSEPHRASPAPRGRRLAPECPRTDCTQAVDAPQSHIEAIAAEPYNRPLPKNDRHPYDIA